MRFVLVAAIALLAASPASAMTYYLSRDLGTQGFQHYCQYSDGKTYSVNATEMCPMSIDVDGFTGGGSMGFKAGEYQDGLTKVCVYNVMGNQRFLRLNGMAMCPMSYNF